MARDRFVGFQPPREDMQELALCVIASECNERGNLRLLGERMARDRRVGFQPPREDM